MKKIALYGLFILCTSCTGIFMDEQKDNTPRNNFDLLWQIFDERYCFFEEKNIDWDSIYQVYSGLIQNISTNNRRSSQQMFDIMAQMLMELEDGHVSISNKTETRTFNGWYTPYPDNCDEGIILRYLNRRTVFLENDISFTHLPESIGYIRIPSFSDKTNRVLFDEALNEFSSCKGVIIDVRNNGGGIVSETYTLASRFVQHKTLVGYMRYKNGTGHHDFSKYYERYIEPEGSAHFHGKVAVLTNRRVYSAANLFVSIMKCLPQVQIIGDHTGGGG
ncbi:MAG: S41 family peptidase, partial [Bacteroidales bacterium]|nr:S41 family peptidase [Bacteroidales bacterium]